MNPTRWHRFTEPLRILKTQILLLLGSAVAILVAWNQFQEQLRKLEAAWAGPAVGGILIAACALLYAIRVVRYRPNSPGVELSIWIGAESYTKEKRDRFFGRDQETAAITAKLLRPHLRYLLISGKSGTGKSSLIQAGLIPELEEKHGFACEYIRLLNNPVGALCAAVNSRFGTSLTTGDDLLAWPGPEPGQAKTFAIFLDQFEEFLTNSIPREEKETILRFFRQCGQTPDGRRIVVIFGVRSEVVDDLSFLRDYVDLDAHIAAKDRVNPFDSGEARFVIDRTLAHAGKQDSIGRWEEELIGKILDDLSFRNPNQLPGQPATYVLPAELSIVCQLVQSRNYESCLMQDEPGGTGDSHTR